MSNQVTSQLSMISTQLASVVTLTSRLIEVCFRLFAGVVQCDSKESIADRPFMRSFMRLSFPNTRSTKWQLLPRRQPNKRPRKQQHHKQPKFKSRRKRKQMAKNPAQGVPDKDPGPHLHLPSRPAQRHETPRRRRSPYQCTMPRHRRSLLEAIRPVLPRRRRFRAPRLGVCRTMAPRRTDRDRRDPRLIGAVLADKDKVKIKVKGKDTEVHKAKPKTKTKDTATASTRTTNHSHLPTLETGHHPRVRRG